jgi:hypothetical protein
MKVYSQFKPYLFAGAGLLKTLCFTSTFMVEKIENEGTRNKEGREKEKRRKENKERNRITKGKKQKDPPLPLSLS